MSEKAKHLLFIFRDMGTGGAQKVQAFVANACLERGYRVSAISLTTKAITVDIDKRIPVYTVDFDNVGSRTITPIKWAHRVGSFLNKLRKKVKSVNPDLLVVFLVDTVRMVEIATKGLGIPILGSERGDPIRFSKRKLKQYSRSLNQCKMVVFQLEEAKKPYTLKPALDTRVIPNPCVPRIGQNFAVSTSLQSDSVILSAGRLCKQKRFDILIKAFGIVHKELPEYKLIIYGEGDLRDELEKLISDSRLKDCVKLPGSVKDPFDLDIRPKIFALASDSEGIPNVLIEAMGNGIACIAADCSPGGAAFLLDSGRRGKLVPKDDWQTFGKELLELAKNQKAREVFAEVGREIFDLFPPEKITKMWLNAINDCFVNYMLS